MRRRVEKRIDIGGESLDRLMVDWLSELLYLHDVEGLLFKGFRVESVGKDGLKAIAKGEPFQEGVHVIKTEVKAVTYYQIEVRQEKGRWRGSGYLRSLMHGRLHQSVKVTTTKPVSSFGNGYAEKNET